MKSEMAADQVLERLQGQIRKEDASKSRRRCRAWVPCHPGRSIAPWAPGRAFAPGWPKWLAPPSRRRRAEASDKRSAVSERDTCLGDYAGYQGRGVGLGSSLGQTWRCPFARAEHRRGWLKKGSLTATTADRTRSARESLAPP